MEENLQKELSILFPIPLLTYYLETTPIRFSYLHHSAETAVIKAINNFHNSNLTGLPWLSAVFDTVDPFLLLRFSFPPLVFLPAYRFLLILRLSSGSGPWHWIFPLPFPHGSLPDVFLVLI